MPAGILLFSCTFGTAKTSMRKRITIFLLVLFPLPVLQAQGIRGTVTDQNGEPLPYSSIFIRELTRGTTCNALGQFSLPLPKGHYTVFFRSLGYTEVTRSLELDSDFIELDIALPPQTYMIPEVRISAGGEDPAYWIMRKAIGLANYHLNEVLRYKADIYIKGTAYFDKIPRAIAKRVEINNFKVKANQAYMLESLNEVQFTAPDKYEMRVIASQNTLPGYTQNVNPMDYINASLYQQQIEGVVSPLARNAFSYYRFSFEGTFMEGTHIVNKIKVIPKRKSQQMVSGYLHIVEDLWCLHSSDLSIETIAGTLSLQQLYANIMMDAWMPVNHKIRAQIDIAGVKGSVTYVSSLKYDRVKLNPNLPKTFFSPIQHAPKDSAKEAKISPGQKKINELLEKDELNNRDVQRLSKLMEKEAAKAMEKGEGDPLNQTGTKFSIADSAVKNDSLYWNQVRPIPLTPNERITLHERDKIIADKTRAGDSGRIGGQRSRPGRDLLRGKAYRSKFGHFRFVHGGLLDAGMLNYNAVDGLSYGQEFRINWKPDTTHTLRSTLRASWAFNRKAPLIRWDSDWLYASKARGKVALYLRYKSADFNQESGMHPFPNLVYTLFFRENHLKLYEQLEATLYNRIDIVNGLVLSTSLTAARKSPLTNHSDFSFFYRNSRDLSPNHPSNLGSGNPVLRAMKQFKAEVLLEFTPQQPYIIRAHRKALRESAWPTFSLRYTRALPLESSGWSEFSMLEAGIDQGIDIGLMSSLDWALNAGWFPKTNTIHFSDFKHFKTNPLLVDMAGFDRALILADYYSCATPDHWVRAALRLDASYLALKFLPWFSERLWKEALHLDYLYTSDQPHYIQFGYSLNELFFLADIGVFTAFRDWKYAGCGIRLNFRF